MKVILNENIKNLGQKNDIVDVSVGYARNYLILKSLARPADQRTVKELEKLKETLQEKEEYAKSSLENLSKKTIKDPIEFVVKAGSGGEVFGSVKEPQIIEAIYAKLPELRSENFKVLIEKPLKDLGVHNVILKSKSGESSTIKVELKPEN